VRKIRRKIVHIDSIIPFSGHEGCHSLSGYDSVIIKTDLRVGKESLK
jgi:hypothetical protein